MKDSQPTNRPTDQPTNQPTMCTQQKNVFSPEVFMSKKALQQRKVSTDQSTNTISYRVAMHASGEKTDVKDIHRERMTDRQTDRHRQTDRQTKKMWNFCNE